MPLFLRASIIAAAINKNTYVIHRRVTFEKKRRDSAKLLYPGIRAICFFPAILIFLLVFLGFFPRSFSILFVDKFNHSFNKDLQDVRLFPWNNPYWVILSDLSAFRVKQNVVRLNIATRRKMINNRKIKDFYFPPRRYKKKKKRTESTWFISTIHFIILVYFTSIRFTQLF